MAQYSHGVILVWGLAGAEAQAAGHDTIEPGHLLLALCKLPDLPVEEVMHAGATEARKRLESIKAELAELRRAFDHVGLDRTAFRRRLRDVLGTGHGNVQGPGQIHRSSESRKVFAQAERIARAAGSPIRPIHLLAAVLEVEDSPWEQLLAEMDVEATDLARVAKGGQTSAGEAGKEKRPSVVQEADRPARPDKPARQPEKLSVLEKFGRDLTRLAADGKLDPVIGRRNEMRTLAQVLMQKRKNSAILIGEAGVGKTCVVEGLAQRIVGPPSPQPSPPAAGGEGRVRGAAKPPSGLEGKRIVEVTLTALVAGAKYRGEFEERMQALVREAASDRYLILFIDEIHTLMGAGGEGSSDAANILKPALARGDLRVIGATTVAEYRKYIEKDPALERRFQVVWVEEPTSQEAIEILRGLRSKLEEHHDLAISDEAIEAAVDLSMRYLTDFRLPDKAIDLIDQACARARLTSFSVPAVAVVKAEVDFDRHARMSCGAGVPPASVGKELAGGTPAPQLLGSVGKDLVRINFPNFKPRAACYVPWTKSNDGNELEIPRYTPGSREVIVDQILSTATH